MQSKARAGRPAGYADRWATMKCSVENTSQIVPCAVFISIDVTSRTTFHGNGGLGYSFAVDGYDVALYEYVEVFV